MNPENISPAVRLNYTNFPIFYLQLGSKSSLFLDRVLRQAQLTNGKENVFLLTDTNFHLFREFNCIDISKYASGHLEFDKVYKHHSTNTFFFEKTCFDRWFLINELVKDLNIDHFFYADCDVLLLSDLNPVHDFISKNNYEGTTMFFEKDGDSVTSAHSSFWSKKLIGDFCDFIYKKYINYGEFESLLKDTIEGKFLNNTNVSDMILLDLFRRETKPPVLNLFSLEERNICFDFNLNVSYNGWEHSFKISPFYKIKKISRMKDGLYGHVTRNTAPPPFLKFYTLHFQGYLTKALIPIYITYQTIFEFVGNNLTGNYHYIVRKMKLLKNKVKKILLSAKK